MVVRSIEVPYSYLYLSPANPLVPEVPFDPAAPVAPVAPEDPVAPVAPANPESLWPTYWYALPLGAFACTYVILFPADSKSEELNVNPRPLFESFGVFPTLNLIIPAK